MRAWRAAFFLRQKRYLPISLPLPGRLPIPAFAAGNFLAVVPVAAGAANKILVNSRQKPTTPCSFKDTFDATLRWRTQLAGKRSVLGPLRACLLCEGTFVCEQNISACDRRQHSRHLARCVKRKLAPCASSRAIQPACGGRIGAQM